MKYTILLLYTRTANLTNKPPNNSPTKFTTNINYIIYLQETNVTLKPRLACTHIYACSHFKCYKNVYTHKDEKHALVGILLD